MTHETTDGNIPAYSSQTFPSGTILRAHDRAALAGMGIEEFVRYTEQEHGFTVKEFFLEGVLVWERKEPPQDPTSPKDSKPYNGEDMIGDNTCRICNGENSSTCKAYAGTGIGTGTVLHYEERNKKLEEALDRSIVSSENASKSLDNLAEASKKVAEALGKFIPEIVREAFKKTLDDELAEYKRRVLGDCLRPFVPLPFFSPDCAIDQNAPLKLELDVNLDKYGVPERLVKDFQENHPSARLLELHINGEMVDLFSGEQVSKPTLRTPHTIYWEEIKDSVEGLERKNLPLKELAWMMVVRAKLQPGMSVYVHPKHAKVIAERVVVACPRAVVIGDRLAEGGHDRILIIPSLEDDIKYIRHSLQFLKTGGVMVGVCRDKLAQSSSILFMCDTALRIPEGTFVGIEETVVLFTLTKNW